MTILQFDNGAVYKLSEVISAGDASLLYGLAQEYTPLGRLFVDSIWHNKPVTLVDTVYHRKTEAKVWRCHITGPVFAGVLKEAREKDPEADCSAVWELRCGAWESIAAEETAGLLSQAKEAEAGEIVEYHLDHPYYKK